MQSSYLETGYYLLPYHHQYWSAMRQGLRKIQSSQSIQTIIKTLLQLHSMTRGTEIRKFDQLLKVPQQKTIKTFNKIASFVLQHEQYYTVNYKRIPLFTQHNTYSHTFTKQDVVLLMCIFTLCISANAKAINDKFKTKLTTQTDCAGMYGFYKRKIPFLMNYFDIVFEELKKDDSEKLTISRLKLISLRSSDVLKMEGCLGEIQIENNEASIDGWNEDTRVKVDFANRYIGGGTLNRGCVQQEIMFLNHPQACISILLCDPMLDNQAIGFHGFKKYSKNIGYSTTTQFSGQQKFPYTKDEKNHANDYIIAIDALHKQPNQYSVPSILRELNKCRSGFSLYDEELKISTGNWGCGVFKGDVQLKFVIQWISASIVNRRLVYYPYGNKKLVNVGNVINVLRNQSINIVFKALTEYNPSTKVQIFQYLIKTFG